MLSNFIPSPMKKSKVPPVRVINAVNKIRGGIAKVSRKLIPPQFLMFEMISAMWMSQAVSVAARLGIADVLKDNELHFSEIAKSVDAHPDSIYRLMRALTTAEILTETKLGYFRLTACGQCLRGDVSNSVKAMAIFQGQYQWQHWGDLFHSVRTGEPSVQMSRGKPFFDFIASVPEAQKNFDLFMTSVSSMEIESVLSAYKFDALRVVADIGGGHGKFMSAILQQNPTARGILFDQPQVVSEAKKQLSALNLSDRCEVVAGDFFKDVPAGADVYVMKHIIHDWEESLCIKILKNIREKIPKSGRLVLIETVVPEPDQPHFSKLLDLEMLVNVGGKERTHQQFAELLSKGNFRLKRVISTVSMASIIEAVPV